MVENSIPASASLAWVVWPMKRPSFQFYPADWRNNAKLRRCSEAARGAWVDVLCVLHDSDEYGVCRWPLEDLARSAGVTPKAIRELVAKEVLKGADSLAPDYIYTPRHAGQDGEPVTLVSAKQGPCWYSSRLVRDEYVRTKRGMGSRFDTENQPPKQSPKAPNGDGKGMRHGDGPSSPSSSSSAFTEVQSPNPVPAGPTGASGDLFGETASPMPRSSQASSHSEAAGQQLKPKSAPKASTPTPAKPREQNETLNTLATVGGGVAAEVPKTRWSAVQKCLREIREVCPDVTADEIRRRAQNYRSNHPDWTLTPEALRNHWASCGTMGQAAGSPVINHRNLNERTDLGGAALR